MKQCMILALMALGLSACVSGVPMAEMKKEFEPLQKILKEDPKTTCAILIQERGWHKTQDGFCGKNMNY